MSNFDRYVSIDINKHFLRLPREQNVVLFSTFRDIIVLPRPKLRGSKSKWYIEGACGIIWYWAKYIMILLEIKIVPYACMGISGNNPMHDDVVESHRSGHVSEEDPWYAASWGANVFSLWRPQVVDHAPMKYMAILVIIHDNSWCHQRSLEFTTPRGRDSFFTAKDIQALQILRKHKMGNLILIFVQDCII